MVRAAIYCRVSSEEQAERGTIDSQIDYAKKYMDLHSVENNITEFEFYLDDGISGTVPLMDRPAAAKMIADATAGKFQYLFVYRLDRLARSVKHVLDTYEILESKKIALKSMTEAFDTGTPTGKFFMTLLASIAALERDTIMERTQLGKERGARQGKWVSGPPPFGYRIGEDGKLEINEEEAETIRLIFKLYLEGYSTFELAKYLNARNIITPAKSKKTKNNSTGKWHAGHVSIILRTTAYMGQYEYLKRSKLKKNTIIVETPIIIDPETFKQVDKKLIDNADAARGSRGRNYLLRGIIYCGNCGRAMVGSSGDSKSGRVYYRCTGATNHGSGKICDAKMIRAVDVENATWQDIRHFLENPGMVLEMMDKKMKQSQETVKPCHNELAEVESKIAEKQAARSKVISLCARNFISDNEAERELKGLSEEINLLSARRDFLFSKQEEVNKVELETIQAKTLLQAIVNRLDTLNEEERAVLTRALTKRVDVMTVEEDGKRVSKASFTYIFMPACGTELSDSGDAKMR
ncbi:MAG: recombinase family protein [Bacillota bacterium]|nr:recombinase family protein [Bacillota bacterium]